MSSEQSEKIRDSDKKCGYSKLNFGIDMKQGWEIKRLDDACEVEYGTRVVQKRDGGTVYPVYGGGGATFFMDTFNREDCLVVARFAISAQCTRFIEGKFFLNDSGLTVRPKNDNELLPDFLNLQMLFLNDHIYSLSRGTAQRNLEVPAFRNIQISYPKSIQEQKHIVAILNETFSALTKAKANAEQNLKNAKELFESYLQGVFEKKGDGWEEKIIKEVCELKSGTTISTNLERTEGDVLYVKVGDMTLPENDVEIKTSSRFVNCTEIKTNQIIPNGAIIFPKRGGAIATNKKRKIVKPTIVDLNTMAIIPSNKIDADYFFHWFQLIDLNSISNGTSIPQINNYSFDAVKIPFPKSLKAQQTIVRQLDALRAETQKLEAVYQKKIAYLEELKKSILQKAFAGELKTEKSRRDAKIIENKIKQTKPNPEGVI